jgi:hypothetical protein
MDLAMRLLQKVWWRFGGVVILAAVISRVQVNLTIVCTAGA